MPIYHEIVLLQGHKLVSGRQPRKFINHNYGGNLQLNANFKSLYTQ